jgi:peptide/nickel transport system permease protein
MNILPVLVIGTSIAASITRMTRSSVLEVMRSDYVLTAEPPSNSATRRPTSVTIGIMAFFKICLITTCVVDNPAIIPIVTLVGLLVAELLGGSAVTEQVLCRR